MVRVIRIDRRAVGNTSNHPQLTRVDVKKINIRKYLFMLYGNSSSIITILAALAYECKIVYKK